MYRSIDTKFWTDPKVRDLSPPHKLLFLYLITTTHSHVSGIYYMPKIFIHHETGLSLAEVDRGIDTLSKAYLCLYDTRTEVVWIRHMLRYQHHGEKIRLAVAAQLTSLHKCPIIQEFLSEYADIEIPYRYPIDTHAGAGDQEQEQEQEQEQDIPLTSFEVTRAQGSAQMNGKVLPAKAKKKTHPMADDIAAQATLKAAIFDQALWDWCQEKYPGVNVEAQWEHFVNQCLARGYAYADFRRAFMNSFTWERSPAQRGVGLHGQTRSAMSGNPHGMTDREYRTIMASKAAMEELDRDDYRRQTALLPSA